MIVVKTRYLLVQNNTHMFFCRKTLSFPIGFINKVGVNFLVVVKKPLKTIEDQSTTCR